MNNFWKKNSLWSLLALMLCLSGTLAFTACEEDEEEESAITQQEYAEKFLSVSHGVYHADAMPPSTTGSRISGVSVEGTPKANGSVTIRISSDVEYERFYIGVDGQTGYIEYTPAARSRAAGSTYDYSIPVSFGNVTEESLDVIIKGQTTDGEVTTAYRQPVSLTNFGIDIGTNNISDVQGKWRCDYLVDEYEVMGETYQTWNRYEITFTGIANNYADFFMEHLSLDKKGGQWDGAWRWQLEGKAKCSGSTLHLWYRRGRVQTYEKDWGEWVDDGNTGILGPYINWKTFENKFDDYVKNRKGDYLTECLVNDYKDRMQWRKLHQVGFNESNPQYNYDPEEHILQFVKQ